MATIEGRLAVIEAVQAEQAAADAGVVLLLLDIRDALARHEALLGEIRALHVHDLNGPRT